MRNNSLLRSLAITGAASMVAMLLGALTTKIIAITAGPSGIAVFSQLRQLGQFISLFATLNGQNSLVRGISSRSDKASHDFAFTVGQLFLAGVVIVGCLYMAIAPNVHALLFSSDDSQLLLAVYLVTILLLLGAGATYYQGVLTGLRLTHALALTQISSAISALLVAYPCMQIDHPAGFVGIVATGFLATILGSTRSLRQRGWRFGGFLPPTSVSWDKPAIQEHLSFASVSLITGLSGAGMVIALRTMHISDGGLAMGGVFDAAWTISMTYVMLLLSSFGVHYLPALSKAKTAEATQQSVNAVFDVTTLLGTVLVATAVLLKPWMLWLLYSNDFKPALDIMRWNMIGDYLKISGWVFGMLLIAHAERRVFAISELGWQITLLSVTGYFISINHEISGIAYMSCNIIYLIFVWQHAIKRHSIKIHKKSLLTWLTGLLLIVLLSILTWDDKNSPSMTAIVAYIIAIPIYTLFASPYKYRTHAKNWFKKTVLMKQDHSAGS